MADILASYGQRGKRLDADLVRSQDSDPLRYNHFHLPASKWRERPSNVHIARLGTKSFLGLCPGTLVVEEINMGLAPRQVPTECSMSSAKKQTAKAAFEIKKGTWQVMTLSESAATATSIAVRVCGLDSSKVGCDDTSVTLR
jgi:hypothetical protein